jgi:hypothetical protein
LFEHLTVHGQGRAGEAVYAETAISGSSAVTRDECVAEEDLALLSVLETDRDRHWTIVRTRTEAEDWERRLAGHADAHCRATANSKGPSLAERLRPVFEVVDRYARKFGDARALLASEARVVSGMPAEIMKDAERLVFMAGEGAGAQDDLLLACLFIFQFAPTVEGRGDAYRGSKWHEDSDLRVRVYLLADYIRGQRE